MEYNSQRQSTDERQPLLKPQIVGNSFQDQNGSQVQVSSEKEETTFSFGAMSRRQKIVFILLACANLFAGCGFSLPGPFFPQEAQKRGVSDTVIGLIFSCFQLVLFLFCPVCGIYLTRVGPKFMFVWGIIVSGCCSLLFGVLDKCPSGTIFIVMCFACRSVEALGISGFITASFAIISDEFPTHVATVFGTLETASGIGMMIGPAIGGGLYEVGGFGPPFYTVGGLIFLNGLLIYKYLPEDQENKRQQTKGMFTLLRSALVWVSLITVLSTSIGISFTDPTLAPHLATFHLATGVIGLLFTIAPALYGLTAPLWGFLSDSKGYTFSLLIVGNFACGVSYLLVGPSTFLTFLPSELWIVCIGLGLLGLGIGSAAIPCVKCMLQAAYEIGFPNNMDTYGIVSGLFNSLWSLGGFVGPTLGGFLVDRVGFNKAASVISLLAFFASGCVVLYYVLRKSCGSPPPQTVQVSDQAHNSEIISTPAVTDSEAGVLFDGRNSHLPTV